MRLVKPPFDLPWPLYHEGANLLHFPILKNAHSSLSDRLKGKPFLFETFIRYEWPVGVRSFAVVRDPFDRYISGLAQVWRMELVAPGGTWDAFINGVASWSRLNSSPWLFRDGRRKVDRHFLPQVVTVERMPDPTLFPLRELGELWGWLAAQGLEDDRSMDRQKRTDPDDVAYARDMLSREIVERHYAADVDMWRAVAGVSA